ncbi:MAG TPA: hypothetical protein VGL47_04355 [Amycolatopsis sp.]|uniref:ESX-1 secretion-associated protein n=1 Tax=Amycolatopsis nalaikhensis TaxID=715472 RepID=A0ABY8XFB2_9PSEU|nr:hypothetical protein [Amycolatopsis sp. 2-2]WIV54291.1 hypothetical protein QP939_36270 [Amycolatopsis sp. 2-2]
MSGFAVEPEKLVAYAELLSRNAGYLPHFAQHLDDHAKRTDGMQGVLSDVAAGCVKAAEWQTGAGGRPGLLGVMQQRLADTAKALADAAAQYTAEDRKRAADLDKTYPDGSAPPRTRPGHEERLTAGEPR